MKAPLGRVVSIYYDSPRLVSEGDALRTTTGRLYLLLEVRRQERGAHIGRWHLKALVTDKIPEGTKVHPIYWYRRERKHRSLTP